MQPLSLSTHEVLGQLTVVAPEVRAISGTVSRETEEDSRKQAVFTPGSVRYIDSAFLNPFTAARAHAHRACRQHGTKFLSGYAIPSESLPIVLEALMEIQKRVAEAKALVLLDYDLRMADWIQKNPEVEPWSHRFPSVKYAEKGIGFSVSIYKIDTKPVEGLEDEIGLQVQGLPAQILQEIADDVAVTWKPSPEGRATQRIRGLLERIRSKLQSLSFLGGDLGVVASAVAAVLQQLPDKGPIMGGDFIVLANLMDHLSDPAKVVGYTKQVSAPTADGLILLGEDEEIPVVAEEPTPIPLAAPAPLSEDEWMLAPADSDDTNVVSVQSDPLAVEVEGDFVLEDPTPTSDEAVDEGDFEDFEESLKW